MKVRISYTVEISDEEIEILLTGYGYSFCTKREAAKLFFETEGTTALETLMWEDELVEEK
jgi:hypothetical protein